MKILILGVSGMIGGSVYRHLSSKSDWQVFGTTFVKDCPQNGYNKIMQNINLRNASHVDSVFKLCMPHVVINCVGVTKQIANQGGAEEAIAVNALLPHELLSRCRKINSRLIHISSDCVFSGKDGGYSEESVKDATDVYGMTKALGEFCSADSLTIRTSTIGHERGTSHGLLEWFLQQTECSGYANAVFSGLPTIELAKIIRSIIIPRPELHGIYNVGGPSIDKYQLLRLIADRYQLSVKVKRDVNVVVNRSLCVDKFVAATGYNIPSWAELVDQMFRDHEDSEQQ